MKKINIYIIIIMCLGFLYLTFGHITEVEPYLGIELAPVCDSNIQIPMQTDSDIINIVMQRIREEDQYQSYLSQEDFREVTAIFLYLQDDLELIIKEAPKTIVILFNATDSYAKGVKKYLPSGTLLALKERNISFKYSDFGLYSSITLNPSLHKVLKRVNENKKVEMIVISDGEVQVYLRDYYFKQPRRVFYRYSNKKYNNPFFLYGIQIADGWDLEIMTDKYYRYDNRLRDSVDELKPYQKDFKKQTVEYEKILNIFQYNADNLDYIINADKASNVFFLGANWKKHLEYVPNSDFLKAYNNYYFVINEQAEIDINKQINDNMQFHQMLNKLGKEEQIRSIRHYNGCVIIELVGVFFEEEQIVEFYYIKNADKNEYVKFKDYIKIDNNWFLCISPAT